MENKCRIANKFITNILFLAFEIQLIMNLMFKQLTSKQQN